MRKLPIHTNSSIACYRRCPREYQYKYVMLRRVKKKSKPLLFGSFFHIGLNAWWGTSGDPVDKLTSACAAMNLVAPAWEIDQFDVVKATELIIGYTARWSDCDFKTVEVESKFINHFESYAMQGSRDVVVTSPEGYHIVEHKTSGRDISPGSPYWSNVVSLDPQVTTYMRAGFENSPIESCIYDVIRKVELEPKLATQMENRKFTKEGMLYKGQRAVDESVPEFRSRVREDIKARPDHYFVRQTVVRTEEEHEEHSRDLDMTAESIERSLGGIGFNRNPGACDRWGNLCEYHGVCSGTMSINNDNVFRTAETEHEELAR